MRKLTGSVLLTGLFFPIVILAADLPTVVIGSENYDKKMCIERYTQDCLDSVCMTSSDTDCNDKCQSEAEDKCQDAADD
ncbi:hypothetical protein Lbir_2616 [Legionella birminghamensis]|uniref:Uncharacterized protein n=1 Tax=Legionella birminghamensis TaxID=28083 RepID=A0A378I7T7_9GAMM|nr:hypothetical protein [Legionella birminghamensis]KTC68014.1 hypothetical protein Lbir_2616 [Legionella birminghamensis]STX31277.1 Uncharacterised protein [Legionella birminghamensis]